MVLTVAGPKLLQSLLPIELDDPRTVPAHHRENAEGVVDQDPDLVEPRGARVLVLGKQPEQVRLDSLHRVCGSLDWQARGEWPPRRRARTRP